jgi:hypothetical protein
MLGSIEVGQARATRGAFGLPAGRCKGVPSPRRRSGTAAQVLASQRPPPLGGARVGVHVRDVCVCARRPTIGCTHPVGGRQDGGLEVGVGDHRGQVGPRQRVDEDALGWGVGAGVGRRGGEFTGPRAGARSGRSHAGRLGKGGGQRALTHVAGRLGRELLDGLGVLGGPPQHARPAAQRVEEAGERAGLVLLLARGGCERARRPAGVGRRGGRRGAGAIDAIGGPCACQGAACMDATPGTSVPARPPPPGRATSLCRTQRGLRGQQAADQEAGESEASHLSWFRDVPGFSRSSARERQTTHEGCPDRTFYSTESSRGRSARRGRHGERAVAVTPRGPDARAAGCELVG